MTLPRKLLLAGSYILVLGVGLVLGTLVASRARISDEWRPLTVGKSFASFRIEALNADISAPDIKALRGTAKFVAAPLGDSLRLGYKVTIEADPLDLSKVPEKYRKERPTSTPGITLLPVEQAFYEVALEFAIKDKDGFTLLELESDPHSIQSGTVNVLQAFTSKEIAATIAQRAADISVRISINKCMTCEPS